MPRMSTPERLLPVREAAGRLGVREETLRVWLRLGRLTKVQLGQRVRVPESALEDFVRNRTVPAQRLREKP
jgi:excisionase family DNA binding protein